jgi:GTP-binding protein
MSRPGTAEAGDQFPPREVCAPGGPDGGDGGKGGSVIFEVDSKLGTLLDLKYHPNIEAKRGGDGGTNNCFGPDGKSVSCGYPRGRWSATRMVANWPT